jgi:serine/threonine protein kinase/formylglycine-generating enzyme required for sulfatase activity
VASPPDPPERNKLPSTATAGGGIDPTEPMERLDKTSVASSAPRERELDSEASTLGDVLDYQPRQRARAVSKGSRFGDYAVLDLLGAGGMGAVFLAEHTGTKRRVALKTIKPGYAIGGDGLERFLREGSITASLKHPGIVVVHELDQQEGEPYLVYELVEGARTLNEALEPLDLRGRVELVRDVARALGHAHSQGVVHRDVKPGNVLVDPAGRARVADFGLAAAADLERITRSAAVLGTPRYMAPEVAVGRQVDPSVDVWALGVILYETLAERPPIDAETWFEYLAKAREGVSELPNHPEREVPPALGEVCLAALRADPRQRTRDANEFADDLDRFLRGELAPPPKRRGGVWLALLGLLVLGLGGAALAFLSSRPAPPPSLAWTSPAEAQTLFNATEVTLEGRVDSTREWVELEITGVSEPVRVPPGPFAVSAPLREGLNQIEVRALGSEGGAAATLRRSVERRTVPEWYLELPAARRAPLPLPAQLEFSAEGYRNRVDRSILVWVPPATTRLGSDRPKAGMYLYEGPEHEVRLDGYFIGRTEVTWRQYRAYCREKGIAEPEPGFPVTEEHPVHSVTWPEAQAYCEWAGLRLPTEAEWEYAARGPEGLLTPWGAKTLDEVRANLSVPKPLDDRFPNTSPVGSFPKGVSPFGCYDMVGNVYEWVFDWLDEYPQGPLENPRGPSVGDHHVMRGGAHTSTDVEVCRTTFRWSAEPSRRNPKVGFRVAFSPR